MENIKNFYKNISDNFDKEKDSLGDGQIILSKTDEREIAIGAEYERESSLDSIINKMLQLDSESKNLYIKTFVSTLIRENNILSRGVSKQVFALHTNSQRESSCDPIFNLITSKKQKDSEIKHIIYSELIEIEIAIQEDKILYYENSIVSNDLKQHLSQVIDWIKEAINENFSFCGSNYSHILQDMIHNELQLKNNDPYTLSFIPRYYYDGKDISDYINEVKKFNLKIYDDFLNIGIDLKAIAQYDQYQIFGWEWSGSIYKKEDLDIISQKEQSKIIQRKIKFKSKFTQGQIATLFRLMREKELFVMTDAELANLILELVGGSHQHTRTLIGGVNAKHINMTLTSKEQAEEMQSILQSIIELIEKEKKAII